MISILIYIITYKAELKQVILPQILILAKTLIHMHILQNSGLQVLFFKGFIFYYSFEVLIFIENLSD